MMVITQLRNKLRVNRTISALEELRMESKFRLDGRAVGRKGQKKKEEESEGREKARANRKEREGFTSGDPPR